MMEASTSGVHAAEQPKSKKESQGFSLDSSAFNEGREPSDQVSLAAENVVKGLHFHVSHLGTRTGNGSGQSTFVVTQTHLLRRRLHRLSLIDSQGA
jgi:hypothetical protein